MTKKEQYFNYLFQAMVSKKMIPESDLWRNNLEYAVGFLGIDKNFIKRLKDKYSAQFSEVILINSTKNILLCKGVNQHISRELCAASVYFSLLGCLLDYWLDSGNEKLKLKSMNKLTWGYCKYYFQDFNERVAIEDIADELFLCAGKGVHRIYNDNPKLYKYLRDLIKNAARAEVAVAEADLNVSDELIYNKSVLFVEIALLLALGNKNDWKESDHKALRKIGLLYAYIDDLIDVYEDTENHQGNIFVKRLCAGESYQELIDLGIQQICQLTDEIRGYFGNRLADFLWYEISDWIFTNKELMRIKLESRG